MRSQLNDNTLTVYLEGRLDIGSALSVQDELTEALAAHPGANMVLDARNLEYISSAGLRVLIVLFREAGNPVPIITMMDRYFPTA